MNFRNDACQPNKQTIYMTQPLTDSVEDIAAEILRSYDGRARDQVNERTLYIARHIGSFDVTIETVTDN